MRTATLRSIVVALGAVAFGLSCESRNELLEPQSQNLPFGQSFAVIDGSQPGGRVGFYFLKPMVATPGPFTGTFDAGLQPTARVCAGAPACASTVASFPFGAAGISVKPAAQSYNAIWTVPSTLTAGTAGNYRLEVFVGSTLLGYADLYIATTSKQAKSPPSGYLAAQRGTKFTIAFRIETRTIASVAVTPATQQQSGPGTQVFTATVTNLRGTGTANLPVTWSSSNTNVATVSPASSNTNADGQATTTATTATQAGSAIITAAVGGVSATATWDVTLDGPPIAHNDAFTTTAGTPLVAANVLNANGGSADDLGVPQGSVSVFGVGVLTDAWKQNAAGTSIAFAGGTLTVAADGTVTLTPTMAGTHNFVYRLDNGVATSDAQVTITVSPAAAATILDATGNGVTLPIGSTHSIGVYVNDQYGNPVPGHTVNWAVTSGGGSVDAGTSLTDASGIAYMDWTLGNTVGQQTATATSTGLTNSPIVFVVDATPGAASRLAFVQQPTDGRAGAAITPAITVAIQDADGNTVTTATDDVTLAIGTNPGNGTLRGTTTVAAVNGVATFSDLTIDKIGTGYTFDASSGSLTGATSSQFTIAAEVVDHFVVEAASGGNIGTQAVGVPFNIQVSAKDQFGNTATAFNGTVDFTSSATIANGAGPSSAFANGVLASHSMTLSTGGTGITIAATRTGGSENGTSNAFDVQSPPVAEHDTVSENSSPGDAFHTALNTTLTVGGNTPTLIANDNLGSPAATIATFGSIRVNDGAGVMTTPLTGQVAAGSTVAPLPGYPDGSLTVNANGTFTFVPPTNYTGFMRFSYSLANGYGQGTGFVSFAVGARPSAGADNYNTATGATVIPNVSINTATATPYSVLGNDTGDRLTVVIDGSPSNAAVTLNSDGTFTLDPSAGFRSGNATFNYRVQNGFGQSGAATVAVPVGAVAIWFVDNTLGSIGNGTQLSPRKCLAGTGCFAPSSGGTGGNDNDIIFLFSSATSYGGALQLRAGQKLIGQAATASLASITGLTVPPHSALPATNGGSVTVVGGSTYGVFLFTNNTLRGFDFGNAALGALHGAGFGTLTVSEVSINTTGQALYLASGTLSGSFTSVTSSGGQFNVVLENVGTVGTFSLGSGALSGATNGALVVRDASSGALTYSGSITSTASGFFAVRIATTAGAALSCPSVTLSGPISATNAGGITVNGCTSGTMTFSGTKTLNSANNGVFVTGLGGTGGAHFTNGGLVINVNGNLGFTATSNTAPITVQGSGNTISGGSGTALTVTNSPIGAAGLTFESISANGGAADGIILINTGTAGGLTVTGNGTPGSGGTIANKSGANAHWTFSVGGIPTPTGINTGVGVYLNNAHGVSLSHMQLNDFSNGAIAAFGSSNLSIANSVVSGVNGDDANANEGAVLLYNLTGTGSILNSSIGGGFENNLYVQNETGSLNRLEIRASTFGFNSSTNGGHSILLQSRGSGTSLRYTIQGSTIKGARGDWLNAQAIGNSTMDAIIGGANPGDSNSFDNLAANAHPAPNPFASNRLVLVGAGTLTYDIFNNTLRGSQGRAIQVEGGTGTATGRVRNNTVGVAAIANSGSPFEGIAILGYGGGRHTSAVTDNQIYQVSGHGIMLDFFAETVDNAGAFIYNATVTGNTVSNRGSAFPTQNFNAVFLRSGSTVGDDFGVCVDIGGAAASMNSVAGGGGGPTLLLNSDIRLNQLIGTTVRLPGYAGLNNDNAAVETYLAGRNTLTTASASNTVPAGGGFLNGACVTPP